MGSEVYGHGSEIGKSHFTFGTYSEFDLYAWLTMHHLQILCFFSNLIHFYQSVSSWKRNKVSEFDVL